MKADSTRRARAATFAVAASFTAIGCNSPGGPNASECRATLVPGDLVITEVMANAIGQSDGKKWIEVYNASSKSINLEGANIVSGSGTTSRHVMRAIVLEPGAYAVLGGVLPEFMAEYHDYAYGSDLDLPGSGGDIAIECGTEVVDSATYPGMSSGVAMGLDGAIEPDSVANDDAGNWCNAEQSFEADGSLGTPGAPNDPCGAANQTTCRDGGTDRELIAPEPGDLVISEMMGNPADGIDSSEGDWFEIHVTRDVDLNGVQLGQYRHEDHDSPGAQPVAQTLASRDCLHYDAGSHVVLAGSDDPARNGALPQVDFVIDFGRSNLTSQDGGVFVGYENEILDYATWLNNPWGTCDRGSRPPDCGAALNRDPSRLTPEESNDPASWCLAGDRFSEYGRGTPGLSNASCYSGGTCVDETGATRDAEPPRPGDLVITEVMSKAQEGLDDSKADWFEVLVLDDVDLNALQIGRINGDGEYSDDRQTLAHRRCLRHEAGSYALFAASDDPEVNSGLEDVYVHSVDSYVITNSGGLYLTLDDSLDQIVEQVADWGDPLDGGIARCLDPDQFSPEGSSNPDNWYHSDSGAPQPYFSCRLKEVEYECEVDGEPATCTEIVCDDAGTFGEAYSYGTPGVENPKCP